MAGISYGLVVGRRPLSARGQAPIAGERGSPCQLLSFAELLERVLGPQCSAPRFMALPCHGRVEMWRGGNRLGIAVVVTLENLGYGQDRLGDMGQELKGNIGLVLERMAISILVVGFVEEFIFRGFIMSRLANIFGGSRILGGRAYRASGIVRFLTRISAALRHGSHRLDRLVSW